MTGPSIGLLTALIRAAARLALPCDDQVAYLRELGVAGSADELALEFDEGLVLAPQFVEAGWLSSEDAQRLEAIGRHLKDMSGPERSELWTEAALCSSQEWEEVRKKAREFVTSR